MDEDGGGLEYSHELVELIAGGYPFAIGAACFPETHIHAAAPRPTSNTSARRCARAWTS